MSASEFQSGHLVLAGRALRKVSRPTSAITGEPRHRPLLYWKKKRMTWSYIDAEVRNLHLPLAARSQRLTVKITVRYDDPLSIIMCLL